MIIPYGKMANVKDIGKVVREERRAQKLRQEDLAIASGVGVRFIHDLERGKLTVELALVLRVVEALGLEVKLVERSRP